MIGPERVMWRFDPILLNGKYSPEYQLRAFNTIATELNGSTEKVTISFIDEYNFGGRSIYRSVGTDGVARRATEFPCGAHGVHSARELHGDRHVR